MARHYALWYGFHTLPNIHLSGHKDKHLGVILILSTSKMKDALTLVALTEIPREVIG